MSGKFLANIFRFFLSPFAATRLPIHIPNNQQLLPTMKKQLVFALLAAATALVSANAQEKKTALTLALPLVDIVGTPPPIRIPNLDKSEEANRGVLLVPAGVTNLAKNKKVTSSDKSPIVGELNLITDGDKDAAEGFEVELAPGPQWVQIDLNKSADLYAIALWHYHRQKRAYKAVVVQISDDVEFKTGVTTVFNTDYLNVHKFGAGKDLHYIETNKGKLIGLNGVKGRYVRLYSAGNTSNDGNHYIEVEVYGK
jgi:hypothetical protein